MHIMKERISMKLIRIKEGTGEFFDFSIYKEGVNEEDCYKSIENIDKENVLSILSYIIENDVEYDKYESGVFKNPAQDLIYKELSQDMDDLKNKKESIIKEIDDEFKEAEEKYSS